MNGTDSTQDSLKLSVLVPIDRRTLGADTVRALHDELRRQLRQVTDDLEIIYLIGTSTPEVRRTIKDFQEQDSAVRVVEFGRVVAYSALVATGMEKARAELLLVSPPYYDVDLEVVGRLYEAVENGADVAIAARRPPLGSRLFNRIVALATGTRFTDIASSTRIIRRTTLDEIPLYGDFDRYLPVLAERLGWAVHEVPAQAHPRRRRSKGPRFDAFWRLMDVFSLFFISRFTRRPLRLFGGVGVVFGMTGVLILLVAVAERFLVGKTLADRPILVLGALLVGLGVQTLTIGLLGELIIFFQARKIRDYRISAIYETRDSPMSKQLPRTEPTTPARQPAYAQYPSGSKSH